MPDANVRSNASLRRPFDEFGLHDLEILAAHNEREISPAHDLACDRDGASHKLRDLLRTDERHQVEIRGA